jgi:hypothetical protein
VGLRRELDALVCQRAIAGLYVGEDTQPIGGAFAMLWYGARRLSPAQALDSAIVGEARCYLLKSRLS